MSYIGNKPATSFETVQKQVSTTNSGTQITLDRAVTSVQDILVTVDAVIQSYDNYSVSGTTLTLGGTLNNNRVEILYVGRTMQSVDPTDDSVSAAKIKTDAVTTAKVQNDAITVDKLNLISTSSVPSLEAKGTSGVTEGYIQLNCAENSHGIKLKSPPHSAGQSYTLTFPSTAPATDKIMQTDSSGNLSFVDAPSSDFVRIATSRSSSSTSAVNFDNVFDGSVYEHYRVFGYVVAAVNSGGDMYWRTGGASGSTYTSSNYIWVQDGRYIDNGGSQGDYHVGTYNDSKFRYATDMKVDGDSGYALFDFLISDPTTNQLSRSYITGTVSWMENTGYQQVTTSFGARNDANVNATGLRFQQESNNIAYHHIQIWGYKKS